MSVIKELCHKLRQKRKDLGYKIVEVVDRTKLHPSVIRDIEDGNLNNINPVYLRGFVKIYASFLDIPLGDALNEVPSAAQMVINPKNQKRSEPKTSRVKKGIPPHIKKMAIVLLIGIVGVWMLISFTKFVFGKILRKPDANVKVMQESQKSQAQEEPQDSEVVMPKIKPAESDEMVVSVTARRNCFLRVNVDGNLLFEGVLKKGLVETWKGSKDIELKISDGSAVYLEVNGESLPSLTSMRKPIKSLKITPAGISVDK